MEYSKKSIWKWVLLYVIIGAITYGLIYYFFFYKKGGYIYAPQNPSYQNQTKNTQAASGIYNNYGIYFEYPKELSYITTEPINKNGEKGVRIDLGASYEHPYVLYFIKETEYSEELKRNLTFQEIVDAFTGAENVYDNDSVYDVEKKNITVDGKSGVWVDFKDRTLERLVTVYIPLDEKGNIFIAGTSQDNYDAGNSLNQILSTFKFTK